MSEGKSSARVPVGPVAPRSATTLMRSRVASAAPVAPRERVLGTTAAGALAACAVPVIAVAGALHGVAGVIGAAAGLGLVAVLFGLAAVIQGWAAGRSPGVWAAVVAGGVGVRLALYLAALSGLSQVQGLHRPSLAIATAVAFVVTLGVELRVLHRAPQLFWVEPTPHPHHETQRS